MLFHYLGYLSISLSSLLILCQILYLPLILKSSYTSKDILRDRIAGFKEAEADFQEIYKGLQNSLVSKRSTVTCENGLPGPRGKDGDDGVPGDTGVPGRRGIDARDQVEEQKCIICPAGPMGPIGAPGDRGEEGEKGDKGSPGTSADDGVDGFMGVEGDIGDDGFVGKTGAKGPDGKNAPGGVGLPGPKGAGGPIGRAGVQGPRGKRNYIYGPAGEIGQPGPNGLDGKEGNMGDRGPKGSPGENGADAKFCPCPIELQLINDKARRPSHRMKEVMPPAEKQEMHTTTEPVESLSIFGGELRSVADISTPDNAEVVLPPAAKSDELPHSPAYREKTMKVVEKTTTTESTTMTNTPLTTEPTERTAKPELTSTSNIEVETSTHSTDDITTGVTAMEQETEQPMVDLPPEFSRNTVTQGPVSKEEYSQEVETTTRRRFIYITKKPRKFY